MAWLITRGITRFPDNDVEIENHVWYNIFQRQEKIYLNDNINDTVYLLVKLNDSTERLYIGKINRIMKLRYDSRETLNDRLLGFGYWPYHGDAYWATKEHITKGYLLCYKFSGVKMVHINLQNRPKINQRGWEDLGLEGNQNWRIFLNINE